jgi:uncharacterized protein
LQTAGEITVDVGRAAAFTFVEDPYRLAQCIPGCSELHEVAPGRFTAVLANKVAFVTLRFKVVVEIVKIEPPDAIEAKVTGEPIGLAGRLVANAGLRLTGAGEQRTTVRYAVDLGLTGKLGGLGQPVFRAKSEELGREFAANLKAAIERGAVETPT